MKSVKKEMRHLSAVVPVTSVLFALKEALRKKRIMQYEAAQRLGITETRVCRIVCGRLAPTDTEKLRFAAMVGQPVHILFGGAEESCDGDCAPTCSLCSRRRRAGVV